jgi:hypothetical protein
MSTNQAIQNAQPTEDNFLRIPQGGLIEGPICTRCNSALLSSPEPEGHEWFIRCLSCRAKNGVAVSMRVVGWRH